MSVSIEAPYPRFYDLSGNPLEDGYIYIGSAATDPELNPQPVSWDAAGSVPAAQPLRTKAGYADRNGFPSPFYTTSDYAITVRDKNGILVYTEPNITRYVDVAFVNFGTSSGSWTPQINPALYTYSVQVGRYRKWFDTCWIALTMNVTNSPGAGTPLSVITLPFTPASTANLVTPLACRWDAIIGLAAGDTIRPKILSGTLAIGLEVIDNTGFISILDSGNVQAGSKIEIAGVYETA